jgi:predicted RNase H-like HicB family nuclease
MCYNWRVTPTKLTISVLPISIMLTRIPHKRTVLLYPDEDGYIIAEVPSLSGCISQGRTREEALENIQEAIALHLEVLQERGESIPEDRIEVADIIP